jgi:hypothetical protein
LANAAVKCVARDERANARTRERTQHLVLSPDSLSTQYSVLSTWNQIAPPRVISLWLDLMTNTLSSYSPLQQLTLTRFGRLKMMQRDVLPHLDSSDYRVKLTLKALYSTYNDLQGLGLEEEARLLLEPGTKSKLPEPDTTDQ